MQDYKIMDQLFELKWSRIYSYVYELALDMDLFKFMEGGSGAKSIGEISAFLGMPLSSARIVVQYLCGLKLLRMSGGVFYNSEIYSGYLTDDKILSDLKGWKIETIAELEKKLKEPPRQSWYQIRNEGKAVSEAEGIYSGFYLDEVRHQWRISQGEELAKWYEFGQHKKLLDIGGASGGWSIGIRRRNPHLHCTIFDLPEVCRLTEISLNTRDAAEKIDLVAGDIFSDQLAVQTDVVLLANVLHDWTKQDGCRILKKVYEGLPDKGKVLIYEYYLDDHWEEPLSSMYHGITVLGPDNESGWQPCFGEMEEMIQECGFSVDSRKNNLLVGVK